MPRISTSIKGVGCSSKARTVMRRTLGQAKSSDRSKLKGLFKIAAAADGNRYLNENEASIVRDVFENAIGPNGNYDLPAVSRSLLDRIEEIATARNADGITSYFTSTTRNMGNVIIDQMREVVAAANGRPVDFNGMLFSFTHKEIGDAILQIAEENPNVSFRFIMDWSQIPTSGSRQAPRLIKEARERGLNNVHIKFKKDDPYIWKNGKVGYNHGASDGLNHHKGMVALIDGKPFRLLSGSFNWSKTAERNWENLFLFENTNPINRAVMSAYQSEFFSFYNHRDTINIAQAKVFKRERFNALKREHGVEPQPDLPPAEASPRYVARKPGQGFDVNDLSQDHYQKLRRICRDSSLARSIVYHVATYGSFADFDEMLARVSKLRRLPEGRQEEMRALFSFGDGRVPINHASATDLSRGLKIKRALANAIIAKRKKLGDFDSVDQLKGLPGMTDSIFKRIEPRINDDSARAFFSARPISGRGPRTGYADVNNDRRVPVMGRNGRVRLQEAKLTAGIIDLANRAKEGDELKVAMYGMSATIDSFDAIVAAARRGASLEVLLNRPYNAGVAAELIRLGREEGLPIQVRFSRRTMHQKFGVLNNDCFFGSANMSGSATRKHSEDRFVVKNNDELAQELKVEFNRLWARARVPA